LNFIPDPWSPYRAIRELGAGRWLRCHSDGRIEEGRYSTLPRPAETPEPGLDESPVRRDLYEAFDDAVRARLVSDVPVSAFLSGGIDSGSVVASMSMQTSSR